MTSLTDFPPEIQSFFSDLDQSDQMTPNTRAVMQEISKGDTEGSFKGILNQSGLPFMELDLPFDHNAMAKEALKHIDMFASHRSDPMEKSGNYLLSNKGWKALAIHGLGAQKTYGSQTYGYRHEEFAPYSWTEIADSCPMTKAFFANEFPYESYRRVRYSLIEPGGFIYPHKDRPRKGLWEINLALLNPEGFYLKFDGGGYVPFQAGKAFILDTSNEHAVVNLSDQPRIHIIVHGKAKAKPFYDLLERSFLKVEQQALEMFGAK